MTSRVFLTVLVVGFVLTSGVGIAYHAAGGGHAEGDRPLPASVASTTADSYVLEQGGVCQPIEPLSTGDTVEEFYDYRDHETHPPDVDRLYSSYGTTHLQEDDTSILFLHEGPDGVSFVMVLDQVDGDSAGGLASVELVGLPLDAEWVVKNDDYGGENSDANIDEFDSGPGWATASWGWREARTSGGAINGGLDGEFALTIHPAFNDEAQLADQADELIDAGLYDDGEIERLEALSGDADDPERTALSLEEPITIRTGTCDGPSITYDRSDDGDVVTAHVENADVGDPLSLTAATGSGGVAFGNLEVIPTTETVSLEFTGSNPDATEYGVDEAFTTLGLTGEGIEDETTVHFAVEKATLESHGFEPGDVTLYERYGSGWAAVETELADETADDYRFVANTSTASAVTVTASESGLGLELEPTSRPVLAVVAVAVFSAFLWVKRQ
ncbi:PGF-pre-PGF domain-containing protein [Natrialbaceae archaeon A-gly3]